MLCRLLFFFVSLALSATLYAQEPFDTLISGTWKFRYAIFGNDTLDMGKKDKEETFSFYADTYRHRYTVINIKGGIPADVTMVQEGRLRLRKKKIILVDQQTIEPVPSFAYKVKKEYRIIKVTRNELVLKDRADIDFHYIRTSDPVVMPNAADTANNEPVANQKLYLISAEDTTRSKYISTSTYVSITLIPQTDSLGTRITEMHGKLLSVTDSSLRISLDRFETNYHYADGNLETTSLSKDYHYEHGFPGGGLGLRTIDFRNIKEVTGKYEKASNVGEVFSPITGFSLFTALIVAPLASINYRTWDFNQNRYYWIAGSGIALFSVTLPITIASDSQRYFKIKLPNDPSVYDRWYLDNNCSSCSSK